MSRLQQYQSNFTLGEIDPLLRGRVDLQQYYSALETAKNVLIEPQGGFSRRPGLQFLLDITTDFYGSVLLVPFYFNAGQTLMIVMTNDNGTSTVQQHNKIFFRVYENKVLLTSFEVTIDKQKIMQGTTGVNSIREWKVEELDYAQSADTILFTHPFIPAFSLRRGTSNANWVYEEIVIKPPTSRFHETNISPSASITPDAVEGSIKITASGNIFHNGTKSFTNAQKEFVDASVSGQITLSSACSPTNDIYNNNKIVLLDNNFKFRSEHTITDYNGSTRVATLDTTAIVGGMNVTYFEIESHEGQIIQVLNGIGRARIIEVDTETVVKAVTETPFFEADTAIATNKYELQLGFEKSISQRRGYFRTISFHEGRLFMGGTHSEPTTLFGSKVGQPFNFELDEGLDDDALKSTLATDDLNEIVALKSGRDLQIFTTGGEFFLPQGELDPVTPSNLSVKQATRRGAKKNIKVQGAEGGTLFIQNKGKSIREMLFSDVEASYVANNISLLSSHLIIDPQRMALRPATDTTEGDLLMIVNGTNTAGYRSTSLPFAGSIACFMLNKSQNIVAPSHFTTDGDFLDVAVDDDDIYTVVKRRPAHDIKAKFQFNGEPTGTGGFAWTQGAGATITFKEHDGTVITIITGTTAQFNANGTHANNTYYIRHTSFSQASDDLGNIISNHLSGFSSTGYLVPSGGSNQATGRIVTRTNGGGSNLEITKSGFSGTYNVDGQEIYSNLTITGLRNEPPNNDVETGESKFAIPVKIYLEVFDKDFTTDSAVQITSGFSGTTYTGFDHIKGQTVDVIRDDIVEPDQFLSGNSITVQSQPTTYVEAGINYDVEVKTMPFETKLASGVVQSQKRRIVEISPVLFKTQNIEINGFNIPLGTFPYTSGGALPIFTGVKKTMGFRGYTRDAQITIKQTEPVFMTVLSLDYKVSIGQ